MCLERCGGNRTSILNNLRDIANHKDILTGVSFEAYNLGSGSQLVKNNLTSVHKQISALGLETLAMISSYPYPPDFLSWMRQVFANPKPFIDACISEALKEGYTGYNVDWEPTTQATNDDAIKYAAFLTTLSNALHQRKLKVTVDIASWSTIWNYTALAASSVDTVMDMSTYTGTLTSFVKELNKAVTMFPLTKLGVGLETDNTATKKPYTDQELQPRFLLIESNRVQEIDIWDMPIPANWWPFLSRFSSS